jgi:hypothetical protein
MPANNTLATAIQLLLSCFVVTSQQLLIYPVAYFGSFRPNNEEQQTAD